MNLLIKINSGPSRGQEFAAHSDRTIRFGRSTDADTTIDDSQLSGIHFEIVKLGSKCMIRDLDSTNGTTLNGLPVVEAQLNDGDEIVAGTTSFLVMTQSAPTGQGPSGARSGFTSSIADAGPSTAPAVRPEAPTEKFASPTDNPFSSSIVIGDQHTSDDSKPTEHVHSIQSIGTDSFSQSISGVEADDQILINSDFSKSIVVNEETPTDTETPPAEPIDQGPVLEFFSGLAQPLYAVLDAARDPMILPLLMQSDLNYQSLYDGVKGQELIAVAPYLVHLPVDHQLLDQIVEQWGESWGIFLTSNAPFKKIRNHLQRFLIVRLDDGKNVFFRFYDPRVLRVYLPTCTSEEIQKLVGPLDAIYYEGEELEILDCQAKATLG